MTRMTTMIYLTATHALASTTTTAHHESWWWCATWLGADDRSEVPPVAYSTRQAVRA